VMDGCSPGMGIVPGCALAQDDEKKRPQCGRRDDRGVGDSTNDRASVGYIRSKTAAMPCPPPMHMVTSA